MKHAVHPFDVGALCGDRLAIFNEQGQEVSDRLPGEGTRRKRMMLAQSGERVTCEDCLAIIKHCFTCYTLNGKSKVDAP